MNSWIKRIIMIVVDAVTLILGYFVAYYASILVGINVAEEFVNLFHIFVAIKIAVYLAFWMYSLDPRRSG